MPKLPTAAELGSPERPRIAGSAGQYDIGGDATAKARATVGLGREVTQLGAQLAENQRFNELLAQREGEQRAQEIARESEQTKLMVAREQARLDSYNLEDAQNRAKVKMVELALGEDGYSKKHGKNGMGKPFFDDYNARFDNEVEKIKQELDPRIHGEFDRHMVPVRGQYRGALLHHMEQQANKFAAQTAENTIAVESNAAKAAGMRGDQVAFDAAAKRIEWTLNTEADRQGMAKETRERMLRDTMSAIHLNIVDSFLNNLQDYKKASAYYNKHKDKIDREIGEKIEGNLVRAQKAIDAENERKRNQASELIGSDLTIKVHRGQAGYGEIERLHKEYLAGRPGIQTSLRTALVDWMDSERQRQEQKAKDDTAAMERVSGAISGRYALDHREKKDKEAVEIHFENTFLPTLAGREQSDARQAIADYVGRTNIIPESVMGQIRGKARGGTPEEKVAVADLYERIRLKSPGAVEDFAREDVSLLNSINIYTRAGMKPGAAVLKAEEALKVSPAEKEARATRYRTDKVSEKNLKKIQSESHRWFSSNIKIHDGIVGDYDALVNVEFMRHGDMEIAQKTAQDLIQNMWGVTYTHSDGKPRWMKYAPEIRYKVPGEDGSWIREQLHQKVYEGSSIPKGTQIMIEPTPETALQEYPSYVVLTGPNLDPVIGHDGRPMQFRPDYASSPAGQRRLQAQQKRKQEQSDSVQEIRKEKKGRYSEGTIRPPYRGSE